MIVGNGQSEIAGQFRVIVTAKPDADLAHIEAVVDEEIGKLLQTGPTQAEIDKNIVQVVSGEIRGLQSAASKAATLATWETYIGNGAGWKESIKRLEAATPATVRDAAQRWLTKGSYTLTVMPFGDPEASGQTVDRGKVPEPGRSPTSASRNTRRRRCRTGSR